MKSHGALYLQSMVLSTQSMIGDAQNHDDDLWHKRNLGFLLRCVSRGIL